MVILIVAIIVSAILYRAGGMGREVDARPTWMPMFMRKSWVRDWLCPGVFLIAILPFYQPHNLAGWLLIPVFYGITGAALTTYWDKIFGYDNFFFHGFGCGLAGFILITFVPWWLLAARLIICTLGMGLWSEYIGHDEFEEEGRGAFFIL